MTKPCIIGLCGRSGAGKSFVSHIFEKFGVPTVDTDAIYREMTSPPKDGRLTDCMAALVNEFGEGILTYDRSLDRRALSAIVFSDGGSEARKKLNSITHRYILEEADRRVERLSADGAWAVIIDAPLLFESGYNKKCDFIVAASAPEHTLVDRIIARDRLDTEAALRRLAVQIGDEEIRKSADFVIETDDTEASLTCRVGEVISEIRKLRKVVSRKA